MSFAYWWVVLTTQGPVVVRVPVIPTVITRVEMRTA